MTNDAVSAVVEQTQALVGQAQGMSEKMMEWLAMYGMRIVGALLILLIGIWAAKMVRKVIEKMMERSKVEPMLVSFVCSLAYCAMVVFVVIAALEKLDVKTTSFIAILGAAGLAVGLALQGSLANFASGVLIIIFKPFKIGDFIEAAGVKGVVREMHIFTTTVSSPDNKKVIIPNAKLTDDNITNYSANDKRRVDLTAGISYGDDIDKARASIRAVLAENPKILKDPAPQVSVIEMGDSSVNFVVRPWTKTETYWDVYFEVTEGIKKRFDADGISIPFPQRDVHIYEHKENA
jgi:small conductance mechanosensitive channel